MNNPLYFLRLPVHLERLWRLAGERNWLARNGGASDEGLALHHALNEVFGPAVLKPFRLMMSPGEARGFIYSYSQHPPETLRETAALCGPEYDRLFELDRLQTKPMSVDFSSGRQLGFDIRLRPVRRSRKTAAETGSREIDVFLHEALEKFPQAAHPEKSEMIKAGRKREAVYGDWFQERLAGAADISRVKLVHFRRSVAIRNGQVIEGPDAILQGNLTVGDSRKFAALIRHGVGRHKAYGYGMLLLRPPGSGTC